EDGRGAGSGDGRADDEVVHGRPRVAGDVFSVDRDAGDRDVRDEAAEVRRAGRGVGDGGAVAQVEVDGAAVGEEGDVGAPEVAADRGDRGAGEGHHDRVEGRVR